MQGLGLHHYPLDHVQPFRHTIHPRLLGTILVLRSGDPNLLLGDIFTEEVEDPRADF